MLGWYTKNKTIQANIPDKDRSQYSQERWKFFLDAPFDISNKCCKVMKKTPSHDYNKATGRHPMIASMADESRLRTQKWLENGCNGFHLKEPVSNPMSFWTEQDVLEYIYLYLQRPLKDAWSNIYNRKKRERKWARKYLRKNNYRKTAICSVYGEVVEDFNREGKIEGQISLWENDKPILKTTGCKRTGCMLCGFGCHLEKESRFVQLKETHPKMYGLLDVMKNNGMTFREAIEWTNEHGNLDIKL